MSEFRFRRYVMKGAKAEGICVRADSIAAAIPKAIDLVYEDQRPVTILIADNLATKIEELEKELTNYKLGFATANERVEELEATLERVRALPDKWRDENWRKLKCDTDWMECADELEAALKGDNHGK